VRLLQVEHEMKAVDQDVVPKDIEYLIGGNGDLRHGALLNDEVERAAATWRPFSLLKIVR
jgi:hypothetical protein